MGGSGPGLFCRAEPNWPAEAASVVGHVKRLRCRNFLRRAWAAGRPLGKNTIAKKQEHVEQEALPLGRDHQDCWHSGSPRGSARADRLHLPPLPMPPHDGGGGPAKQHQLQAGSRAATCAPRAVEKHAEPDEGGRRSTS